MTTRILGIDPGSRITGYGLIDTSGQRAVYVASGCIQSQDKVLAARLKTIFEEISALVQNYEPHEMAVEIVFMNRNADSALKLGQARGAALAAGVHRRLPIFEFTPTQIKQAIVGQGNASKAQVQYMVKALLGLTHTPASDAADALAVALCHAHTRQGLLSMKGVRGRRGRRLL